MNNSVSQQNLKTNNAKSKVKINQNDTQPEKKAIETQELEIPLNHNGLNSAIKRHRSNDCIKKIQQDPTICCLLETHVTTIDTN
jgi:hypothetical protein